jgi:uncharacterized protein
MISDRNFIAECRQLDKCPYPESIDRFRVYLDEVPHQGEFMILNPATSNYDRNRSILALLLIVPPSSIGAASSTMFFPGSVGQGIAICCGIWTTILPIAWHVFVERQNLKLTRPNHRGLLAGIILAIFMFGLILGSYWFGGRYLLNIPDIRARVGQMGMNIPLTIFGFGTFQTLVNSFVEEYVWRWFVDRHCRIIWSKKLSLFLSAIFFTLHHIVLLTAYCDDWRLVLLGSIAVFIAGLLWARCIRVYDSLLPSYLSHMAADLALQIVSWHILLG